jgi:hypothetical protein
MLTLQLELSKTQARALSRLIRQVPAHNLREWADAQEEADAMREALDVIRKALLEKYIEPV